MADGKSKRDSIRKDIQRSLREIDDPDEYRDEWYKTSTSNGKGTTPERDALYESPEGTKRKDDFWRAGGLGAAGFVAQRFARGALRGGKFKPFTGAGAATFPLTVGAAGGVGEAVGAEKRRQEKKRRK